MSNNPDVLVIGLGAMGAAITYQLARCGLKVIGIDQFSPPHDRGSTHGETRITRLAIGEGPQFVPLAMRSHEIWREIESESGDEIFNQCGGLIIAKKGQGSMLHGQKDFFGSTINAAASFQIEHELLDADGIAARFPHFELSGDERGYFEPEAGYLNPENGVEAQLKLAVRHGAKLITGHEAALKRNAEQTIVECDGVEYRPEKIVISAGGWLPQLVPEMATRLTISRQVLYWFRLDGSVSYAANDFPIFMWNWGSGVNDHFYGFPQVGHEKVIKIATEQDVETTTPETIKREVTDDEKAVMARNHIVGKLRGVTSECVSAATCLYTRTGDSNFIIDWLPGRDDTLIVSPCSGHGFKHSAAIGEAVAEMVETGVAPKVLEPFGL